MGSVPRPLIALLLGTVAFFALWMVALKPSSSSSGNSSSQGLGAYQSAINKAHQTVAASSGTATAPSTTAPAAASAAGSAASRRATHTATSAAKPTPRATSSTHPASTADHAATSGQDAVQRALQAHKVVVMLVYNPAAADDQLMHKELKAIPSHNGHVDTFAIPVNQLSHYNVLTRQVPVNSSPTLVLISPKAVATTLVGFADQFEINQRVADALS